MVASTQPSYQQKQSFVLTAEKNGGAEGGMQQKSID